MKKTVVLTVLVSLAAMPAFAGFHYIADTSVDGEGGEMGSMTVEGWVDGPKAKMLFTASGNPMMPVGSYLLTQDAGRTLYLVRPEEGTFSVWNLEEMFGALGGAMNAMGGLVKMEVSDLQVEKLLEEDGEPMHGYPTTHRRFRTAYTMQVKVMGMRRADRYESEQDVWTTTALGDDGFSVWLRSAPRDTGIEGFDQLIDSEYAKVTGFPLKTVERTVTTGVKKTGRASTSITTMEVQLLEEMSVDAEVFELDPELRETPMMIPGAVSPNAPQSEPEQEEGGMFKKLKKRMGG